FVTAKGGTEALIDLRRGALARQQAVAGRIDAEASDATQRPARQAHQEQEDPPAPAEQSRGTPFHGGLQDAGERGAGGRGRSPKAAPREAEARQTCSSGPDPSGGLRNCAAPAREGGAMAAITGT